MHILITLVIYILLLAPSLLTVGIVTAPDLNQQLGQVFLDILNDARLPVKVAAPMMGLDESTLRKAIRGEPQHELRLPRLMRLPFPVFAKFWNAALYVRGQQTVIEVEDTLNLRREA